MDKFTTNQFAEETTTADIYAMREFTGGTGAGRNAEHSGRRSKTTTIPISTWMTSRTRRA